MREERTEGDCSEPRPGLVAALAVTIIDCYLFVWDAVRTAKANQRRQSQAVGLEQNDGSYGADSSESEENLK